LDRKAGEYDCSYLANAASEKTFLKRYLNECIEKRDLIWSLIGEDGQFAKTGPKDVSSRYKSQIEKKSRNYTIALEWKAQSSVIKGTSWTIDVPKDTPERK